MFRLLTLLVPVLLLAEGIEPRPTAAAYPVHSQAGKLGLGAEFMVHSFMAGGQTYVARDYLVVEVGAFPGEAITLNAGQFILRVNGKKQALLAQTPGMVVNSIQNPDWSQRPQMEATAGMGNTGVILGRPVPTSRFPDDPNGRTRPRPGQDPAKEVEPEKALEQMVPGVALPEGPRDKPIAGYLFFAYQGKVKTVELRYEGPAGSVVMKLR